MLTVPCWQGPKQNTVLDFWRMVVEKQCRHIIMLTNCQVTALRDVVHCTVHNAMQEQGRVKCFQYWPPNGQMLHFDDISLFTSEEVRPTDLPPRCSAWQVELQPGLLLRKVELSLEEESGEPVVHIVRQVLNCSVPYHTAVLCSCILPTSPTTACRTTRRASSPSCRWRPSSGTLSTPWSTAVPGSAGQVSCGWHTNFTL